MVRSTFKWKWQGSTRLDIRPPSLASSKHSNKTLTRACNVFYQLPVALTINTQIPPIAFKTAWPDPCLCWKLHLASFLTLLSVIQPHWPSFSTWGLLHSFCFRDAAVRVLSTPGRTLSTPPFLPVNSYTACWTYWNLTSSETMFLISQTLTGGRPWSVLSELTLVLFHHVSHVWLFD